MLTNAAEHRDTDTGKHVRRISYLAAALSRAMNLDAEFVDTIFYASPMHDIGKIGIPDSVLLKPGPLSSSEWAIMRTHTTLGKRILQDGTSPYIRMGATIAETHHECWDGSGYPAGLREEQIPIPGRIMLLCDQYDALRSKRPYKAPLDHEAVTKVIEGEMIEHGQSNSVLLFLRRSNPALVSLKRSTTATNRRLRPFLLSRPYDLL